MVVCLQQGAGMLAFALNTCITLPFWKAGSREEGTKRTACVASSIDIKVRNRRQERVRVDTTPVNVVHVHVSGQIAATCVPEVVF